MKTRIKNSRSQNIRGWGVVFCSALFYLYQFMVRVSPNIMSDEIMSVFSIDAASLGGMISIYYLAYVAMQLPLGITMDRLGPRVFVGSAAFICAFSCYLFGHTDSLFIAGVARFLMGMGSACGLIGTIKLGTIWIEPKHVAKVTGFTLLFGTFGASLGGSQLKLILNNYGFSETMTILSVLGVVVGIVVFTVVSNKPPVDHHEELPDIYENQHPLTDIRKILGNKQAWIIALYGMLMYIPITIMGVAWGVSLVEKTCSTSKFIAASVVSAMFLGAAFGSPVLAMVSDSMKSRKKPMIIGSIAATAIWFVILTLDNIPISWMYVLFFIAGFIYTAKCLTFASICEIMPLNMSGLAVASINMIVMSAGVIFNPIIGFLIHSHWDGKMIEQNIPLYSTADYQFALMIVPIMLALSTVILVFLKETHPEHKVPEEYGSVIDTDVL